jgi:hypothetical protein
MRIYMTLCCLTFCLAHLQNRDDSDSVVSREAFGASTVAGSTSGHEDHDESLDSSVGNTSDEDSTLTSGCDISN